jgi:hypothetical protein
MVAFIIISLCAEDRDNTLINAMLNNAAQPTFEGGGVFLYIVCLIGPQGNECKAG